MLVGGDKPRDPTSEGRPPRADSHAKLGRERIESRGRPSGGGLGAAPQAHSRSFIAGTQLEGCLLSMGQKCNGNSSKRPCFTQAATLFRITTPRLYHKQASVAKHKGERKGMAKAARPHAPPLRLPVTCVHCVTRVGIKEGYHLTPEAVHSSSRLSDPLYTLRQ